MKTMMTAMVVALGFTVLGCGTPVEDGSAEDVAAQAEALTLSGNCQVKVNGTIYTETGYCIKLTQYACATALSPACTAGKVVPSMNLLYCHAPSGPTACTF